VLNEEVINGITWGMGETRGMGLMGRPPKKILGTPLTGGRWVVS